MPPAVLMLALLALGACAAEPRPVRAPRRPPPLQPFPRQPRSAIAGAAPTVAPPSPSAPAAAPLAAVREIRFAGRDGLRFTATLDLPPRCVPRPVPAVVIVHGSGSMTRAGIMTGQLARDYGVNLRVYEALARALTARGVAVLRYDKRGSFPLLGVDDAHFEAATTVAFADDALRAFRRLRLDAEVDATRLHFVGHSQGGQLVPLLLTETPEARAGVLLTTPHSSVSKLLKDQAVFMRSEGRLWRTMFHAAGEIARLDGGASDVSILERPASYWYRWELTSKAAPFLAARLERPLLVIGGGDDLNVQEPEFRAWRRALEGRAPEVGHRFRHIPCMTHTLHCLPAPGSTTPPVLAPGLVDEIAQFVRGPTATRPPASCPAAM